MDVDFSIELGPPSEEAVLELPWDSGLPGGPRYTDLRRHPELLSQVAEAVEYPELGEFLLEVNSSASFLETAKSDVWLDTELTESEEVYGAHCKMAAYVDLVFAADDPEARLSFPRHQELITSLVARLREARPLPVAVEFILRRCYYHEEPGEPRSGFYVTAYILGYGKDERDARRQWQAALKIVSEAILHFSGNAIKDLSDSRAGNQ